MAAANYILGSDYIQNGARKIASRFLMLNGKQNLSPLERAEYLTLADARKAALRLLQADLSPVDIFKDPSRFYDFKSYRKARDLAEDALLCTSALSFPFRFHVNHAAHMALPWGTALIERYFKDRKSPLKDFYRHFILNSAIRTGDLVGINVTFISQIPEAFYLAKLLRQMVPSLFIVFGGSAIQQILSHADEAARRFIVTVADAACEFEGEACLPSLMDAYTLPSDPKDRFTRLKQVPNLLFFDQVSNTLHQGPLHITDLSSLPPPDYSDLDLTSYLAPEPILLFSPTRGCYWNKCAFCDYGLNRSGSHDYREMDAGKAARQLIDLSKKHGVRNFYLSVDVMSPRFAEKLAEALVAEKADIHWSADFRIETHYTARRLALLYQSGLRAVAFGVESGSDRMLKKMDKGISVEMIQKVNARFHQAGIATAWMTFSHHPGECETDSLETVRLIERERHAIDLFILGKFGLTSGSRIFNHPREYGVRRVFYCRADDFRLFPLFEEERKRPIRSEERLEDEIARLSRYYYLDHYPWAGAISTHHTFLYFLKLGKDSFRKLRDNPVTPGKEVKKKIPKSLYGLVCRPEFSINRLEKAHDRFMEDFFERALLPDQSGAAPLDASFFRGAFASEKIIAK